MRKKVDKLQPRDKKIVRLRLFENKSRNEVAEIVGVDPMTVTRAVQKKEAQEYADKLDKEREKRYMDAYGKAMDYVMGTAVDAVRELGRLAFEAESEVVRKGACKDLAYMAGLKPHEAENIGRTPKLVVEDKPKEQKEAV